MLLNYTENNKKSITSGSIQHLRVDCSEGQIQKRRTCDDAAFLITLTLRVSTTQLIHPHKPNHSAFSQFEYQQAQLEAEIENLSWKVERAEMTDRGDLENQMDIVEKRRTTLLSDFQA